MVTSTVLNTKLYIEISDEQSKIPTYICNWKVVMPLCKRNEFLLADFYHNIIVGYVIRRDMIEYKNILSLYYEQDSDFFNVKILIFHFIVNYNQFSNKSISLKKRNFPINPWLFFYLILIFNTPYYAHFLCFQHFSSFLIIHFSIFQ